MTATERPRMMMEMPRDNAELATETVGAPQTEAAHPTRQSGHHAAAGHAAVQRIATEQSTPTLENAGAAFLTQAFTARFPGQATDTVLPRWTYVEIDPSASPTSALVPCIVYSGFGGVALSLPRSLLHAEPKMGHGQGEKAGTPADYNYANHPGVLWHHAPKIEDVAQGYLGDCYLIAAMGAVLASNPRAITSMFSPQTPNLPRYHVTLHRRGTDGKFVKHVEVVDTYLPSQRKEPTTPGAPTTQTAAYADNGRENTDFSATVKPLWPALIEKAYAQMIGGYDVAGQGGSSTTAMEAMTGLDGSVLGMPSTDEDVLAALRTMQGRYAMAIGSVSTRQASDQGGFTQVAPGSFHVDFMTDQGEAPEIMVNTLEVMHPSATTAPATSTGDGTPAPAVETVPTANDDGTGKIVGTGVSGTVSYGDGKVSVAYDPATVKAPVTAAGLRASYTWEGLLDKNLTVYANHAYIFERVTSDGMIQLRNPWGVMHPKPMTAADFRRLFVTIYSGEVPKTASTPVQKPPRPKA